MTLHHPITPAAFIPDRLVGVAALRSPATGSLGWGARLVVVGSASVALWAVIFTLAGLIA